MKAVFKQVNFNKEVQTKFGSTMYAFNVKYTIPNGEDRFGSFLCKDKNKPPFEAGQEYDILEDPKEYNGKTYYNVKPYKQASQSGYSKQRKVEQTKYAGFAVSYVKDLLCKGVIICQTEEEMMEVWKGRSKEIFDHMVALDKSNES